MREILKFFFYRWICPFLLFSRVDRFLRGISRNRRLIIMYHGIISDKTKGINARHSPSYEFEKHLIYFKNNFSILSLAQLCELKLKNIQPEKHTIALTFDDGYLNNVLNVLPLLRKHRIPATFFVSSVCLKEKNYIHPSDYLDLINFFIKEKAEINEKVFKKGKYHLSGPDGKTSSVYQYVNSLSLARIEETFSDLEVRYPRKDITRSVNEETFRLIAGHELRTLLTEDLITIGSHGHLHVNFEVLSNNEIRDQLGTSKEILNEHGVDPVEAIAFPYGCFNENVLSISRDLGFKYLIAGGSVEGNYESHVFPRIGILNLAGVAYNMLSVNRAFNRFGF